jgi:carboxypeptidase Taq
VHTGRPAAGYRPPVTVAAATESWDALETRMRELSDLSRVGALLGWDQETMMPRRGAEARSRQIATMAGIVHERLADPALGELLEQLAGGGGSEVRAAMVRNLRRERDRALRLPPDFVRRLAGARSLGIEAWRAARAARDFAAFQPHLETLMALKREQADQLGHDGERYDALVDLYDPGLHTRRLEQLFDALRGELRALLDAIRGAPHRPPPAFVGRRFPDAQQWAFTLRLLGELGFDLEAGRQDRSAHPFTSSAAIGDVRLTTRIQEQHPFGAIFATIHEAGHGLYEQGLDPEHEGTPVAQAASSGMHESQSRMWENVVGRSRAFWDAYAGPLRECFPEQLADATPEDIYRAANLVSPSLIRVEADEVTYNLHISIRFGLELALLRGHLAVADLPAAWNDAYERELGVRPPHDGDGVLQDVHWSAGMVGSFPSYTLGNLYAAIIWRQLRRDLPDVEERIRAAELAPILGWLRVHVHRRGHIEEAEDLLRRATGSGLDHAPFVDYLWDKFGPLYGVTRAPGAAA